MPALASWFIELSTTGKDQVGQDLDSVGAKLKRQEQAWKESMAGMQRAATVAFAAASAGLAGFVRAGLQGTVQGERMNLAWKQLSQQLAAVFLPVVEAVTDKVQGLANWFKGLSANGQNAVMWVGGLTTALLGAAVALPKVAAGFRLMASAIGMSSVALAGHVALLVAAAAAARGIASAAVLPDTKEGDDRELAVRNKQGRERDDPNRNIFQRTWSAWSIGAGIVTNKIAGRDNAEDIVAKRQATAQQQRRDVIMSGGNYEDVGAAYKRLQSAALKQDPGLKITEKQQQTLEQIRDELKARPMNMAGAKLAAFAP